MFRKLNGYRPDSGTFLRELKPLYYFAPVRMPGMNPRPLPDRPGLLKSEFRAINLGPTVGRMDWKDAEGMLS